MKFDPRVTLSYIVPVHNSAEVLESTLTKLRDRLSGQSAEIIVVENGSTDRSWPLLERVIKEQSCFGVQLRVCRTEKGLGNAVRRGIAESRGERIVLTADDLPFGFDELDAAQSRELALRPVVIGSKAHSRSVCDRSLKREVLAAGFYALRKIMLGMRTRDPQGTYVLDGPWARAVRPRLVEEGFLVTTELCYIAEQENLRPVEVPVRLRAEHDAHQSRMKLSDLWQMGSGLFAVRHRHFRRKLGSVSGVRPISGSGDPSAKTSRTSYVA